MPVVEVGTQVEAQADNSDEKKVSYIPAPNDYKKVSRWANESEVGGNQRLYVTTPGAPKPGGTGPVRIDFYAPESILQSADTSELRQILQPQGNSPI